MTCTGPMFWECLPACCGSEVQDEDDNCTMYAVCCSLDVLMLSSLKWTIVGGARV